MTGTTGRKPVTKKTCNHISKTEKEIGGNMKFEIKPNRNLTKVELVIQYTEQERKDLENILENKLGLEKTKIENGWGKNEKLTAYVEPNEDLKNLVIRTLREGVGTSNRLIADDLNMPIFIDDMINIAFFRVVPDRNHRVKIKLDHIVFNSKLKRFYAVAKDVYKVLYEIVTDASLTIDIRVNE